ncbi:MAG: DUF4300 family protein [Nocardioides sp.]
MKRRAPGATWGRAALAAALAGLTLAAASCAGEPAAESPAPTEQSTPSAAAAPAVFTNLVTDADRAELRTAMAAAGLTGIDDYLTAVKAFNAPQPASAHLAATPTPLADRKVDRDKLNDRFLKGYPYKQDLNCRLAAFTLLGGSITAASPPQEAGNFLMFDVDALETDPGLAALQARQAGFVGVFNEVSVKDVPADELAQTFLAADAERGLEFGSPSAELIRIVLNDPMEHTLFVGHTGVALPQEDGFWFIEKLAPFEPFQLTKYGAMDQLVAEMNRRYTTNDGAAAPIILRNRDLVS